MKPYTFDLIPVTCLVAYTYYPGSGSNFDQLANIPEMAVHSVSM